MPLSRITSSGAIFLFLSVGSSGNGGISKSLMCLLLCLHALINLYGIMLWSGKMPFIRQAVPICTASSVCAGRNLQKTFTS
ncbi:hypothetical protein RchiOBHm_Chr5g0020721 [Rosa chinensis]|uniref:Uncharacterized protein n=1 Tax=Rosa chinensis TaxID=74649 RepID=A0A2P6Q7D0_ROSCH|nr:hypothetical protein RchiOBHm_Chr5g0020721 [Rosa chinensis]